MELREIYPNYEVEDKQFECKAILNRDNIIGWLKTVDAFCNTKGGVLFIGVENGTNKLIGFDSIQLDKEKNFFFQTLEQHFAIMPVIKCENLPYEINEKLRYILKITIFESEVKPIILKYESMPMIFLRRDGYTNAASEEEIRNMYLKYSSPIFDSQVIDKDYSSSDFKKLFSFYELHSEGKKLTDKELASINFFNSDGKLKKGAWMFSDLYDGKETKVVCSLYKGITKGDDFIIASNTFSGNLIDCYNFMWEFVQARMNHGFLKIKDSRININSYPSRALFEAIINSLAHRDYLLSETQISLDMFSDRLVISSPGSLYNGDDFNPTYKLNSFISRRRNPIICDTFVLCHVMEAKGTGFEKIEEDYSSFDEKHKPYVFSKNNQFNIVLPDVTNSKGVLIQDESINIHEEIIEPSKFDKRILAFCYYDLQSIKDITLDLGVSDSTFFRKNIIERLVKQNFLTSVKQGKTTKYLTNRQKVSLQ